MLPKRLVAFLLSGLLCLAGLVLCLFIFVYINAENIIQNSLQTFSASSGYRITAEHIDLSLFPLKLEAHRISISKDEFFLQIKEGSISPSFLALLQGKILPEKITIQEAVLTGRSPVTFSSLSTLSQGKTQGSLFLFEGSALELININADIKDSEDATLQLKEFCGNLRLYSFLNHASGKLSLTSFSLYDKDEAGFALSNFYLEGSASLSKPLDSHKCKVRGKIEFTQMATTVHTDLTLRANKQGRFAEGYLWGGYVIDSIAVPFAFRGKTEPLSLIKQIPYADLLPQESKVTGQHILLQNASMGTDSAGLDAILYLDGKDSVLSGRLSFTKLSLTRWLTFARWLSPGLQKALDEISEGIIDFTLDAKHLYCPRVQATACNFSFEGEGGVADWKKPVVFLDLESDYVKLDDAMPEAVGVLIDPPHFLHRPLTDLTGHDFDSPAEKRRRGKVLDEGEPLDISYDIRLSADTIDYGIFQFNEGKVVIIPALQKGRSGEDQTLLKANAQVYGGNFAGGCIIGGTHAVPEFEIFGSADKVDAAKMRKVFTPLPLSKGKINGNLRVTSQSKNIDHFLSRLNGKITAQVSHGSLAYGTAIGPSFSTATAQLVLQKAEWDHGKIGFDGTWNAKIQGKPSFEASLQGKLWFGGYGKEKGVSCQKRPVSFSMKAERSISAKGLFSVNTAHSLISATQVTAQTEGAKLNGNLDFRFAQDWNLSGYIHNAACSLPLLLQKKATRFPEPFHHCNATGKFFITKNQVKLSKFSVNFSNTLSLLGKCSVSNKEKGLDFNFSCMIPKLNVDEFKSKSKTETKKPLHDWDFSLLKHCTAKGNLRIQELQVNKLKFTNITLPLQFSNQVLTVHNIKGSFYDGVLNGNARCLFNKKLDITLETEVKQFSLCNSFTDLGTSATCTAGRANFSSLLRAELQQNEEIIPALRGHIAFRADQGVFQSKNIKGKSVGKPLPFAFSQGSGVIDHGILRTEDFHLTHKNLDVRGKGTIDITQKTLDANLVVDMTGLPLVPMRIFGPLSSPKTSISGGKVFINTIAGIIKGAFGLIGSLVTGPIDLFRSNTDR